MVNGAKAVGAIRELGTWVRASGKTFAMETKPCVFSTKGLKYAKTLEKDSSEIFGSLSDKSLIRGVTRHPLRTPDGKISEDGLVLVRMDNDLPKDGFLRTTRDIITGEYGSKGTRNSLHFCTNGVVQDVDCGKFSWKDKKYGYIIPFKKVENLVGGSPADIYTKGSVRIQKGSYIVRQNSQIPQGKYKITDASKIDEFKDLHGVKIIETSEQPHNVTNTLLEKLGYEVKSADDFCWDGTIDKSFIEFLNSKNMFSAIHGHTPNAKCEFMIESLSLRAHFNSGWSITADGKLMENVYQKEFLAALDQIETLAKTEHYPLDFDTAKLREIIKTSDTPKIAMDKIRKDLKLTEMFNDYGNATHIDETQFYENVTTYVGSSNPLNIELNRRYINYIKGKGENNIKELSENITKWFNDIMSKQAQT